MLMTLTPNSLLSITHTLPHLAALEHDLVLSIFIDFVTLSRAHMNAIGVISYLNIIIDTILQLRWGASSVHHCNS